MDRRWYPSRACLLPRQILELLLVFSYEITLLVGLSIGVRCQNGQPKKMRMEKTKPSTLRPDSKRAVELSRLAAQATRRARPLYLNSSASPLATGRPGHRLTNCNGSAVGEPGRWSSGTRRAVHARRSRGFAGGSESARCVRQPRDSYARKTRGRGDSPKPLI